MQRAGVVLFTASIAAIMLATVRGYGMRAMSMAIGARREILYDMPVSNHGARCRMIIKAKGLLGSSVEIQQPAALGGLVSPEYERLNPQKKMPLLVTEGGYPIPESDTISRYLLEKYAAQSPSFVPAHLPLRVLSEQIVRLHDIYMAPIQGCLYKAPGYIMSVHGTDRRAALRDLVRQIENLEGLLRTFDEAFPNARKGGYLCGTEISLADAALFPTYVFWAFMMPRFFDQPVPGPLLAEWFRQLSSSDAAAATIREEIEGALRAWEGSGRWAPILEELKQTKSKF